MIKHLAIYASAAILMVSTSGAATAQVKGTGLLSVQSCDEVDLEQLLGASEHLDFDSLDAAESARIVLLAGCATGQVTSALTTNGAATAREAVAENRALVGQLTANGLTPANVLGTAMQDGLLIIYVDGE